MQHAFTVDVEDWYHGIPVSDQVKSTAERRLGKGLAPILEALSNHGSRGTFFLLGPIAEEHPAWVKRIAAAGHEIGCHGWSHDLIYTMTRERFREETLRNKRVLEDLTGREVSAYRAAYFSITRESFWALEELAGLGFKYDSSIFPVKNWRYGIPDFKDAPQTIETPQGPIRELPISVREVLGRKIPVSGGAYFRIYPFSLTRANILHREASGRPAVFYLHPWELDPEHPRLAFDWKARTTHYINLKSSAGKLKRLFETFSFAPLGEVLSHGIH
jgi:polysaccharide deacetylase family protein (PEP-CTERM system associated)